MQVGSRKQRCSWRSEGGRPCLVLMAAGLDAINAAVSVALATVVAVTAATGNATVSPVASTPTISQPAAGSGISGAAPGAIVGQAPPGSVVEVYDGDKKLGETKADQAGNYRFSLPTLAPGQHTLSTRTNDANGNPIASSAPIPVTVSGGQVAQVSPIPAGAQAPTFTDLPQGTQWPSGMPVMLSGAAPPGSKVQVFANDKLVGETVAGPDGKWSVTLPPPPPGDYFLTTRAYGPNGALLGESAPVKVTVVGPGTPTVAVKPVAGQATAGAGVAVTRTAVVTSAAGTAPKATLTASLAMTATRITTATLTGPAATAQAARPIIAGWWRARNCHRARRWQAPLLLGRRSGCSTATSRSARRRPGQTASGAWRCQRWPPAHTR